MTERQMQILAAIIEQYAEVASPVGSVTLAKLFGVSSATIRSEMAKLEELGLITQPHTSAGRIPTDQGYRFYVNTLNESQSHDVPQLDRSARAIEARVNTHGDRADRFEPEPVLDRDATLLTAITTDPVLSRCKLIAEPFGAELACVYTPADVADVMALTETLIVRAAAA